MHLAHWFQIVVGKYCPSIPIESLTAPVQDLATMSCFTPQFLHHPLRNELEKKVLFLKRAWSVRADAGATII